MKTTITLPDSYHRQLRKMAVDQSSTLNDLIKQALEEKFFSGVKVITPAKQTLPLSELKGFLSQSKSTEKEVMQLKKIWKKKK